ncbi:MAG TPA: sulfate ABC transporter substrate-binding protein [Gemmataceae bacterium]|jgi:sulfate transport system substrate-binding protein|nr:sulfate ABC transporter substrate-binding protein [Gemmataceae bacterium]
MRSLAIVAIGYLVIVPLTAWVLVWHQAPEQSILNVSYDPTRELWRDLNKSFQSKYEAETGKRVAFRQSHGGSGSQARAVIDGLDADVVTLAMWSDTEAISKKGLIAKGWEERLPNHSLPYYSTIVFVVRQGNSKKIRDWEDLIQPGVSVITPNPKTSANGRMSFLAAWGAVLKKGGSAEDAERYVTELYRHTPVLDTGARGSAMTFAQKKIGDVHIAWENEAHQEVRESGGELEIVYPKTSMKAELYVAWVDANIDRKGTRAVAEAYLKFLYTDEAQRIIAEHHYRPFNEGILREHPELKEIDLFTIKDVAKDWDDAQNRFFGDGGVFDRIFQKN